MIVVISHHWCKPDRQDEARQKIDQSGVSMESAPGFLYRYRIEPPKDPTQISTITAWTDEDAFRTFRGGRSSPDTNDPSVPYARLSMEVHEVCRTHGKPQ